MSIWGDLQCAKWADKVNLDRRVRFIRRWWWNVTDSDDFKMLVWMLSVFALGVMVWGVWLVYPR